MIGKIALKILPRLVPPPGALCSPRSVDDELRALDDHPGLDDEGELDVEEYAIPSWLEDAFDEVCGSTDSPPGTS